MTLSEILSLKYPDADFKSDIILQDDGEGVYIKEWNIPDSKMPTHDELKALEEEVQPLLLKKQNDEINKPIYKALDELDLKSIRALRTGDTARLKQFEAQAQALRNQLVK